MNIMALDHTALNVSNVSASRKFYTEALGLTEIQRPDFEFGGVWYGMGGDQQLHLIEQKDLPAAQNRMNHHFAFRVDDVAKTRQELESKGVNVVLQNSRPDGVSQIFVADPDGYVIEFSDNIHGQPQAI